MKNKLKIGLIVNSKYSERYNAKLLQYSKQSLDYEITHLIVYDFGSDLGFKKRILKVIMNPKLILRYFDTFIYKTIQYFEKLLFLNSPLYSYNEIIDLSIIKELEIINIKPLISNSGYVFRFSQIDVNKLKAEKFDFMIRGGMGILQGNILNATKYGILSFHHGDNNFYRGGPSGFWELYNNEPETGFIIQLLNSQLDGGTVLVKGSYQTQWFSILNQANVIENSVIHMHKLLVRIGSKGWASIIPIKNKPYYKHLYTTPNFLQSFFYFLKLLNKIIIKIFNRIFGVKHFWGIAIGQGPIEKADLRKAKKIPYSNKNGFIADPFIIEHQKTNYVFCEELDYKNNKGRIVLYRINNINNIDYLGVVLEENFHLSFPFIFQFSGKFYMIPESHKKQQVRLYESEDFPFKWKLNKVIFDQISASDPMIFKHNNIWWLFLNMDSGNSDYHNSELHAFYSENPVNGTWIQHEMNPIVFKSNGGRNAGIINNDFVGRFGQCQDIDLYGKKSTLFKINELSKKKYSETELYCVKPNFFKNIIGTHHFSENSKFYVTDFQYRKYFYYK
jgi:hypothetical protein